MIDIDGRECVFAATESSFDKSGYRNTRWCWRGRRFLHPCRPPETRPEPAALSELWCPLTYPTPGASGVSPSSRHSLTLWPRCTRPSSQVSPAQPTGGRRRRAAEMDPDERRQRFLERNRAAASRCRQKRKIWVNSLEKKAEDLASMNVSLTVSVASPGPDTLPRCSPRPCDVTGPAGNMPLLCVAIRTK